MKIDLTDRVVVVTGGSEHLAKIEIAVEYPDGKIPLTGDEMGDPADVANMTAFMLSDLASHITGTPVWIDGGQSLLQ